MTSQNEEWWYKAQEEMRNKLEDEWAEVQSNTGDFIEDLKNGVTLSEIVRKTPVQYKKYKKKYNMQYRLQQEEMRNKLGERRSNLQIIMEGLRAGKTLKEIARGYPFGFIRYGRGIKRLEDSLLKANPDKPYVIWHYGVTGAGKTRTVRALAPNAVEIDGGYKNGRIDGYYGEEEVIWDNFYASELAYSKLLKLLDYGKQFVRVKGGHVKWRAKTVWFTSMSSPESMYPASKRLLEMIDEIYYWKSKDEWIKIK